MKMYRIDSTRWRIGECRLEIAFKWPLRKHHEFSIGIYKERDGWDANEIIRYFAVGAFAWWWQSPVKQGCTWPEDYRHGWEWTPSKPWRG